MHHFRAKRILDPNAVDLRAVMQIFVIEDGAVRFGSRGENQRIIPGELMTRVDSERFAE